MKINRLLIGASLLLLASCGPIYEIRETFVPPKNETGRKCLNDCLKAKDICSKENLEKKEVCRQEEYLKASGSYNLYIMQQSHKGEKVKKTQDDFANYQKCEGLYNDSECDKNYNLCFTNCGGKIISNKECVAFCDKE